MVYVGKNVYRLGRMKMSHMTADTFEELHDMADSIGVSRKHFQDHQRHPHYDVCGKMKSYAIIRGAIEVNDREIVKIANKLRSN